MSYSNIGYSYSSSERPEGMTTDMVYKYSGDGGLNQLFVGMGFQILKSLSVGFNVGYLWGDMERTVKTSTSSSINTL
jgi:hypothetical protein